MAGYTKEELQKQIIDIGATGNIDARLKDIATEAAKNASLSGTSIDKLNVAVRAAFDSLSTQVTAQRASLKEAIADLDKEAFLTKFKTNYSALESLVSDKQDPKRYVTAKQYINPTNYNVSIPYQKEALEEITKLYTTSLNSEVEAAVSQIQNVLDNGNTEGKTLKALVDAEVTSPSHVGDDAFREKFKKAADEKYYATFANEAKQKAKERIQKELQLTYMTRQKDRFKKAYDEIEKRSIPKPATAAGLPPTAAEIASDQATAI